MHKVDRRIEIGGDETLPKHRHRAPRSRRPIGLLLGAAAVAAGVFAIAYIVIQAGRTEVDPSVAGLSIVYRCSKCLHEFELSVTKSAQMRRDRGDIVCPKCAAAGAMKKDVSVVVSGDEPSPEGASGIESEDGDVDETTGARPTATRKGG